MREHKLKIEMVEDDGGSFVSLFSKGHHGKRAFRRAAERVAARHLSFDPGDPRFPAIERKWWRVMPPNYRPQFSVYYLTAKPRSRGSFPVTVARF